MKDFSKERRDLVSFRLFGDSPTKGDRMRLRIIEEALRCLAEDGIHQVSLERIGSRLKIPRQHVSYYYGTLEDLLDAVFKYVTHGGQGETVSKLESNLRTDWRKLLEIYVHTTFSWCQRHPEQTAALWLFYYYSTRDLPYGELLSRVREASLSRIRAILWAIPEKSEMSLDFDALTQTVFALIVGKVLLFTTAVGKRAPTAKVEKETLAAVVALVEHALRATD